jgi:hypothetical protein
VTSSACILFTMYMTVCTAHNAQCRNLNSFLRMDACVPPLDRSGYRQKKWWSWTGSNRRPEACKATALPTELQPLTPSYGERVVGLGRLELPTSPLSRARSNQLSYRPAEHHPSKEGTTLEKASMGRKRNEDGDIPLYVSNPERLRDGADAALQT